MALQTNVFENGQWVTRTLRPEELLRPSEETSDSTPRSQPMVRPPACGVLTRTILDGPLIRWVLPVQLRSPEHLDVALIGEYCVQICELTRRGPYEDSQFREVARKQDFGSKILNAQVLGHPSRSPLSTSDGTFGCIIKSEDEDEDVDMDDVEPQATSQQMSSDRSLPPQLLILLLESGELAFLFMRQKTGDGQLEFVSSSYEIPNARLVSPGFHMAVDPTSRYLTLACVENIFVVFELESMQTLRAQHSRGQPLRPVKSLRPRAVNGIIHKIVFLYPHPEYDCHVILLLVMIQYNESTQKSTSRLAIYEWERGEDLQKVFAQEKRGTALGPGYEMPLLIIPLMVRSGFLWVSEELAAVCFNVLQEPPEFDPFDLGYYEATKMHHGIHEPLWTAWARPAREPGYYTTRDTGYLAREDGVCVLLEFSDDSIEAKYHLSNLECNIDTAFGGVDDGHADVLIAGGNSSQGLIWSIEARQHIKRIETIPNWSPTVDFVSTHQVRRRQTEDRSKDAPSSASTDCAQTQPDRIFACSGTGETGTITEFRLGAPAKIGLDLDYGVPIDRCWTFPAPADHAEGGFFLLLSFPSSSALSHLSDDLTEVVEAPQEDVPYDLSARTIAVCHSEDLAVQVTTSSITIVTPSQSTRHPSYDLEQGDRASIVAADIQHSTVAVATHSDSGFRIHVFEVEGLDIVRGRSFEVQGDVTCLTLGALDGQRVVFVGIWRNESPCLAIFAADDAASNVAQLPVVIPCQPSHIATDQSDRGSYNQAIPESLTTIVSVAEEPRYNILVIGTRSGHVLTLAIDTSQPTNVNASWEKFGNSPAQVYQLHEVEGSKSIMVCCDTELTTLSGLAGPPGCKFQRTTRIVPINAADLSTPLPPLNTVATKWPAATVTNGKLEVVMISRTRVLVTELELRPQPVLRQLPVDGTPTKCLYSYQLDCIVVATCSEGLPSLHFLDPDTGEDLSYPFDHHTKEALSYVVGLGKPNRKITSLCEWNYRHANRSRDFIVVTLKCGDRAGRLLVVSVDVDSSHASSSSSRKIRCATKWRSQHDAPVWSSAADAQGIFYCFGNTIQYEALELETKKLRLAKQHELLSPAVSMQAIDGELYVATTRHSVEILNYKLNPNSMSMTRVCTDERARNSAHVMGIRQFKEGGNSMASALLSDAFCTVHGLWKPPDSRPLQLVFQAELPGSIRKFVLGHARPRWEEARRRLRYGRLRATADDAEIFGLSIAGSLHHFTLVNVACWRLLRFMQNLVLASPSMCPGMPSKRLESFNPEPEMMPRRNMHVNGDLLQRCLDCDVLEELVESRGCHARFQELIRAVMEDESPAASEDEAMSPDSSRYFRLARDILEYYFSAVL